MINHECSLAVRRLRLARLGASGTLAATLLACSAHGQVRPVPFDVPWVGYETAVYPEGIYPFAARTADFNGDGVPDLATVSWSGTAHLSILLGDGEGGYRPFFTYPIGGESLDLEVGDFDRDGDIDIAVAITGRQWEGSNISIWSNTGQGAFINSRLLNAGSTGPSGLTAADYNNDGWLDLAVAHDRYIVAGNSIAVLLSDGVGNWRLPVVYTLSSGTNKITSADLDGDGRIDLAVAHETNRWTFVRNTGSGEFVSAATFQGIVQGSLPDLPTIRAADFDRDGDLDVFYSHRDSGGVNDGAFGFWRNLGGGNFAPPETISFNWFTNGPVHIHTADVTGDSWPDVLCATGTSDQWYLVPGNGSGGFAAPRRFRAGQNPSSMQAADLDGDGDLEVIVVCAQSMGACVYTNPGNGAFVQPPVIDMTDPGLAPAFPTNLEAGDIDGDGDLDLVSGFRADFAGQHGLSVRRNLGNGTFAPIQTYPSSPYPVHVRLRDINGDRRPDLVYQDGNGAIRARMNTGGGAFGSIVSLTTNYIEGFFDLWDVDADGDLDIVMTGFFEIRVALNSGSGTFGSPIVTPLSDWATNLGMGDFDGDGSYDILTNSGAQGSARIAFGTGNGRFTGGFDVPAGRDVRAFSSGDFDRNGVIDFATIYNLDEKGLGVRRGRGNGDFHILRTYHGSYGFTDHTSRARLADVDGDGEVDVLAANFSAQDASFWRGVEGGTFDRLMRLGVAQNAFDLQYGDFDGDGVGDLAVITQVDVGSWWYPGVSIFKGVSPPSGYEIVLSQTPLRRGLVAAFHAAGARPDEEVFFLYSTRGVGAGPCPPQLGGLCLNLRTPIERLGSARADADGLATLRVMIPGGAPLGTPVHTQAVIRRGPGGSMSVKSRPVSAQIEP